MTLALLAVALCAALSCQARAPRELHEFLRKAEPEAKWSLSKAEGYRRIDLVSQRWQGGLWRHTLALVEPERRSRSGLAVLEITGGPVNDRDLAMARTAARTTGVPVAVLFDIPNQPIWDRREDDLIAHSFERYLETGDPSWPLLFPMVKSAIKAMDALVDATRADAAPVRRFVVTGASKRGWTSWLVGAAGDKRVAGIAPRVFDMLDFPAQLEHQMSLWGRYSPRISDYTSRDLPEALSGERGMSLAAMVDPYRYRSELRVPTFAIVGANDDYWAPDAHTLYWPGLSQPRWLQIVPNAEHGMGDRAWEIPGLAGFVRSLAGGTAMPTASFRAEVGESIVVHGEFSEQPRLMTVWSAESDTLDFHRSEWKAAASMSIESKDPQGPSKPSLAFARGSKNKAFFTEARFGVGSGQRVVCSPVTIVRAQ